MKKAKRTNNINNLSLREGMEEILTMYYEAAGFWPDVLEAEIKSMSDDELMKVYPREQDCSLGYTH